MLQIGDISLRPEQDKPDNLRRAAAERLGVPVSALGAVTPLRRSIDARRKDAVRVLYRVLVSAEDEAALLAAAAGAEPYVEAVYAPPQPRRLPPERPVVAGFGPAGMFAALALAEAGLRPVVLERGLPVAERTERVRRFWETGRLDEDCNVQFGEGGAGAFSDGKLNTGVSGGEADYVLRRFVDFGAQRRILWDAAPHVGTDVLKTVVTNLRARVTALGGEVRFGARLEGLRFSGGRLSQAVYTQGGSRESLDCAALFLAIGHSSRDTLAALWADGVAMTPKAFSMGVRVEHLQAEIDRTQYGRYAGHPALGPASYKLAVHLPDGTGVYTFCMCPGGYVVAAASEAGGVVTNGMSYSGRAGTNANGALLASLGVDKFPYPGPLGGVRWQRELEQAAFQAAGGDYRAPAQLLGDFLAGRASAGPGRVRPTYQPGVQWGDLRAVLPTVVTQPLAQALPLLERRFRGYAAPYAVLTGPETRSSSPVRMPRDEGRQAVGLAGLYPCGEGAGWAGGIVSAAADGLKSAAAYLESL